MNERSFTEQRKPMTTPETHSTPSQIILAAHDLFIAKGYHGTSMRAIAAQAEIALGGIYNHFESKEDIFQAVLEAYHPYHQMLPVLQAAQGETVEAFVHNAAHAFVDLLKKEPNFLNLMFIEVVEFENRHIPYLVGQFAPQILGLVSGFAQRQSGLRDIPVPIILRAFLGFFYSYIMIEVMLGESLMPELRKDALVHSIDIFLHGIVEG
jgi:AcrR family transcriptional regulator